MTRPSKSLALYFKAEAALIAAIEIYNKPDFAYREETFAILAVNAWELLLKAKVLALHDNKLTAVLVREPRTKSDGSKTKRKFVKRNRAGNPQTIGLGVAIRDVEAAGTHLPTEVRGNLEALTEIRDNAVHFFNAQFELAKAVLEIGTACVKNFIALAKSWFDQDLSQYSLYLMPIGFLTSPSATAVHAAGPEENLVSYLRNLAAAQSASASTTGAYHIALDLNITFKRSSTDAVSTFTLTKDPSAPHVFLSEEDVRQRYPWDYDDLRSRCRSRYADFKENATFQKIRKPLLKDPRFVLERHLDPGTPRSSKKLFYNPNIIGEFDKHYQRKAGDGTGK